MNITTIYAQHLTAQDVRLADPIDTLHGLSGVQRCIYIGPLGLITNARNDDPQAWLEAADGLSALGEAVEGMHRWALAQAEAAQDLISQREATAKARRVADFGDLLGAGVSGRAS